ncbi:hypothetical protein TH53_19960 [Pedobacter lusitanus]|uniref:Uncharacterized protein n=1 Tax=Pedobacter lusitanus TaxID=1503925 RepID=A0A0D0GM87_9SPHI|nr:hypothetical protein [Pedobacter lusitanus]KIO75556.1 hypothetical protein TH53_19960 [Pedobacter lusitanus]
MAIRKGDFLIGKLKDLVYRKVKNTQVAQSAPGKGRVRQTTGTKKLAYLFGRASMLGKIIRYQSADQIFGFHDGPMVNRLTKKLQEILLHYYPVDKETHPFNEESFIQLKGFDFNLNSPLHKSLWAEPLITLKGHELQFILPEIKIPEELKFPGNCDSCVITISTNYFDLEKGYLNIWPDVKKIEIKKNSPLLEKQEFSFQLPEGCLCLTTMAIQYFTKKHQLTVLYNHKDFNPAQICSAVVTEGTFVFQKDFPWQQTKWTKAAFDKYATTNQASPHSQPSYSLHTYMEPDDNAHF